MEEHLDTYTLHSRIDIKEQPKLALTLNLIGVPLFLAFGGIMIFLTSTIRGEVNLIASPLACATGAVLAYLLMVLLHEGVHGIFFWLVTRKLPRFGVTLAYAYASAPGILIPRNPYLVIGLAPLVLLTAIGIFILPFVPEATLPYLVFTLTMNAAGAVGDMYVVLVLLRVPAYAKIEDQGDRISIFLPETE